MFFVNCGERMKVLIPIKRVIDAYVKVRLKSDKSGVEDNKMSINPFDDIAVEEAVRLKEKGLVSEVIVVSVGSANTQETLRHGLALGADRALHVETDNSLDSLNLAKVLAAVVKREQPELVILGKQAIDNDNNQTGQMLSALLNWPQHTFASKIELNDQKLTVTREIDGGLETLSSSLPAVVTTDLRLNEPRYASLPNIMKAKRKPIDAISLSDLEIELKPRMEILQYDLPTTRQAGEMLENVEQLMGRLRDKEKIIGEQS